MKEQRGTSSAGSIPGSNDNKLYAFFIAIREWMANWQMPCSNRLLRFWLDKFNEKLRIPESQRKLVLLVVCIALFLDNMLYMVIVPIIPTYLRRIHAFPTRVVYENVSYYEDITIASTEVASRYITDSTVLTSLSSMKQSHFEANNTFIRSFKLNAKTYQSKNEDVNIGVLFACKAIFQLLVNPFTGTLMDRIGYDVPMLIGLIIIFFSTSMFAVGSSYGALFVARSMQGIGSAFADTSGLAMIADRYPEDKERSAALGIALAFISFGSLVAPPFGGTLYEFAGKAVPFLLLALVALFDGCLMMFVMKPVRKKRSELKKERKLPNATPIYRLIIDPYIAVCAGCLVMANVSLAFIEPTIALWMHDTMDAPEWQVGLIWLPAFLPHLFGVIFTVKIAERYPCKQWLLAAIGLALEGISCMALPFCRSFTQVIVPLCILCFGIALVDTAILPLMAHMVDVRHVSVYGSVYAIADISYSMAYAIGPIIAGQIVNSIGFLPLNAGIFVSNIVYAPLLAFLRKAYDYQKFVPDSEANETNGIEDYKLYRTYTSSYEDQNGLDCDERIITNGPIAQVHSRYSDSDDGVTETTALKSNQPTKATEPDIRRNAEYGYNNAIRPVPQERPTSLGQFTADEKGAATTSGSESSSGSESNY
ncbi:probable vesicular acetylcholine transporter-B [Watersipora subatra]|uniref:probable vesicular acetylcholine transporter-B n=1 Tax=Watersipora subatra TaxID=2589382 RepID=UPI00355B6682